MADNTASFPPIYDSLTLIRESTQIDPRVAAETSGLDNFTSTATAEAAARAKASGQMDNLLTPELNAQIFNSAITREELEKLNASLKTTIICRPGKM